MAANIYLPHLLVLPEDDANRQIANGFLLGYGIKERFIQVDPIAGGWLKVLRSFEDEHVALLNKYPNRYLLMIIDFDGEPERLQKFSEACPLHLRDRVFLLGTLSEPEALRAATRSSYESIGKALASECYEKTSDLWSNELLKHNENERQRLIQSVYPIIFK